jgi:hypothetical protein
MKKRPTKKTGKKTAARKPTKKFKRDISTDMTIMRRKMHDEKTIIRSGISDEKTVMRKRKEAENAAKTETKGKTNLVSLGSKGIKQLCLAAGKKGGKNTQALLAVEFKALQGLQKQVMERHGALYKRIKQKGHWAEVNLVLVQLGHKDKTKFADEKEHHEMAAQYFNNRFAKKLGVNKKELYSLLVAEFEMRKTRQMLFNEMKKVLGEPFAKKYEFTMYLKGEDLPELEL